MEGLVTSFSQLTFRTTERNENSNQEIQDSVMMDICLSEEEERMERKRLRREALRSMNVRARFADDIVQVKVYEIDDENNHTECKTRKYNKKGKKSLETKLQDLAILRDQKKEQELRVQAQKDYILNILKDAKSQYDYALQTGHDHEQLRTEFAEYQAETRRNYEPKLNKSIEEFEWIQKKFKKCIDTILRMKSLRVQLQASLQAQYSA